MLEFGLPQTTICIIREILAKFDPTNRPSGSPYRHDKLGR